MRRPFSGTTYITHSILTLDTCLHLDAIPTCRLSILSSKEYTFEIRRGVTGHSTLILGKGMATRIPDAAFLFKILQSIL